MTASSIEIFVVDSFTSELFSGNPAAVCCLVKDIPDALKMKIAAEMNLSETAFVNLQSENDTFGNSSSFCLRWFTPEVEVDLCGHATLAAAAVIFHCHGNEAKTISFETRSGILQASQKGTSSVTLDFPLNPPMPYSCPDLKNITCLAVGDTEIQEIQYSSTTKKLLIRIADKYKKKYLEDLVPALKELVSAEKTGMIKGVIVTLRGSEEEGYDFYSRYFAPWVGIPEDPVTGSAHTVLAAYWQSVYQKDLFKARQCSKRGGDLFIAIVGQRVEITGQVAHVLRGKINIQ